MIKSTSKTATHPPASAGFVLSTSTPYFAKIPFKDILSNPPPEIRRSELSQTVLKWHPFTSETSPAFNIC